MLYLHLFFLGYFVSAFISGVAQRDYRIWGLSLLMLGISGTFIATQLL